MMWRRYFYLEHYILVTHLIDLDANFEILKVKLGNLCKLPSSFLMMIIVRNIVLIAHSWHISNLNYFFWIGFPITEFENLYKLPVS